MSEPTVRKRQITDYTPDPRNANKGTERGQYMVDTSVEQVGLARSIVAAADGTIPAGNKTLQAAVDAGIVDVIEVETDGRQLVVVRRTDWETVDDEQARQYAYFDNRASEVGLEWDVDQLMADLDAGLELDGLFYEDELGELLAGLSDEFESDVDPNAKPNPRQLPIDVIYTLQMADCTCCLAVQAGLKYGIQSKSFRLCPYTGQLSGRHEVVFIDNDYFDYQHDVHLTAVKALKPKYATVCDVMTSEQCSTDGIDHHELNQILDWADELNEYAENVIVIPKYDCLDQIPDHFMLGYSVPTSHGGTPLPTEAFKGRRVHLLGGSWKAQLAHMAALGDDVVSVDNNYIQRQARMLGAAVRPDGQEFQCQDIGFDYLTNVRYAALALSFGAIGAKVNELYAGAVNPA